MKLNPVLARLVAGCSLILGVGCGDSSSSDYPTESGGLSIGGSDAIRAVPCGGYFACTLEAPGEQPVPVSSRSAPAGDLCVLQDFTSKEGHIIAFGPDGQGVFLTVPASWALEGDTVVLVLSGGTGQLVCKVPTATPPAPPPPVAAGRCEGIATPCEGRKYRSCLWGCDGEFPGGYSGDGICYGTPKSCEQANGNGNYARELCEHVTGCRWVK